MGQMLRATDAPNVMPGDMPGLADTLVSTQAQRSSSTAPGTLQDLTVCMIWADGKNSETLQEKDMIDFVRAAIPHHVDGCLGFTTQFHRRSGKHRLVLFFNSREQYEQYNLVHKVCTKMFDGQAYELSHLIIWERQKLPGHLLADMFAKRQPIIKSRTQQEETTLRALKGAINKLTVEKFEKLMRGNLRDDGVEDIRIVDMDSMRQITAALLANIKQSPGDEMMLRKIKEDKEKAIMEACDIAVKKASDLVRDSGRRLSDDAWDDMMDQVRAEAQQKVMQEYAHKVQMTPLQMFVKLITRMVKMGRWDTRGQSFLEYFASVCAEDIKDAVGSRELQKDSDDIYKAKIVNVVSIIGHLAEEGLLTCEAIKNLLYAIVPEKNVAGDSITMAMFFAALPFIQRLCSRRVVVNTLRHMQHLVDADKLPSKKCKYDMMDAIDSIRNAQSEP